MNMRVHIVLLCIFLSVAHTYSISDYYKLFNLSPSANDLTVRAKCTGIDAIRKKKVAWEGALAEDKPALERELNDLIRKGRLPSELSDISAEELRNACSTLLNPSNRSKYNADLARERERGKLEEEKRGKEERRVFNYYFLLGLVDTASTIDIQSKCAEKKRENENTLRGQQDKLRTASGQYAAQLETDIKRLEQLNKDLDMACSTLSDPNTRKAYDTQRKTRGNEEVMGGISQSVKSVVKDSDVLVVSILGDVLSNIPIPDAAGTVFNQKLAMRNMQIIPGPTGFNVRTGLGFTGTMFFNNFAVRGTVYVVEDRNRKLQYSLIMELPDHYKISSMFPAFKKLDALSLPKASFALSSFSYYAPAGFEIKEGFNFIGTLDLTGPLSILNKLKDQAKKLKSVIVRSEPIYFKGVIPRDIKKTSFSATIPLRIGVDLTKIPDMPQSITKIFKEVTSDDIVLSLMAPLLKFSIEGGIRLVLATQPEPIRLSAFGIVEPTSFSLGMRMRNMLELKWFALGNAGVQLDFDEALLPAAAVFGIPFTGIGLNGQVDLGKKGEARATLNLAAGARISSGKLPDLVFDAEAKNIRLENIINLASQIAVRTKIAKKEIPVANLPKIDIERLHGYLALADTRIAQKEYRAGFSLEVDTFIVKHRAGFSLDFKHTAGRIGGEGYISNIDVKAKGKPIFSITGPPFSTKAGKMVEGPKIFFDFDLTKPVEGRFGLDGSFEVPAIGLRQDTHFLWQGWLLDTRFETKYAGFTVLFGATVNLKSQAVELSDLEAEPSKTADKKPSAEKRHWWQKKEENELPGGPEVKREARSKKWRTMNITFGFKAGFAKFLSEQAKPVIKALQERLSLSLSKINEEMKDFSEKMKTLGKTGGNVAQEITRIKQHIKTLKQKRASLKRDITATKDKGKRRKMQWERRGAMIELIMKTSYINALLKPGKQAVKGSSALLAIITKMLADAQILKKTSEKILGGFNKGLDALLKGLEIFQIEEIIGSCSAEELMQGKLPKINSLIAKLNIPGLPKLTVHLRGIQFDFKEPVKSVRSIVVALVKGFRFAEADKDSPQDSINQVLDMATTGMYSTGGSSYR